MPVEITVPRLGWSSEEGLFGGWLKAPGEEVKSGEPLFLLESDKVTMEVESLDSGTLQVAREDLTAGTVVVVGQVLGYLLQAGEGVVAKEEKAEKAGRRPVSPRARARAKELGIDVSSVEMAPGARRVVEADVLRAAEKRGTRVTAGRKVIAARMEESFRAPHFYVQGEVDARALAKLREDVLPVLEARDGVRLSYNDLLVKAVGMALRAVPAVNCYWDGGKAVERGTAHVGLAVQTERALLVPVIRDADRKGVAAIAAARAELVEKCRRGEVKAAEMEGGSVSISNLGAYGVDRFQAILNPGESAIVAVGRLAKRAVVEGDAVVARLTLPLSISVDHRVVDGVVAARFLGAIVEVLEAPGRLLL